MTVVHTNKSIIDTDETTAPYIMAIFCSLIMTTIIFHEEFCYSRYNSPVPYLFIYTRSTVFYLLFVKYSHIFYILILFRRLMWS
jgi:hypothetical protein